MVRLVLPARTESGATRPPPAGASGMLYRTLIAFAALGSVNSTYCPGVSLTAERPEASAGNVYAVRSGPMTTPLVVACSASCSAKPTLAPRPATSAGSSPARVTAVAADAAKAVVPPATMTPRPTAAAVAAADHRDGNPVVLRDID